MVERLKFSFLSALSQKKNYFYFLCTFQLFLFLLIFLNIDYIVNLKMQYICVVCFYYVLLNFIFKLIVNYNNFKKLAILFNCFSFWFILSTFILFSFLFLLLLLFIASVFCFKYFCGSLQRFLFYFENFIVKLCFLAFEYFVKCSVNSVRSKLTFLISTCIFLPVM